MPFRNKTTRREFVQLVGGGVASVYLSGCLTAQKAQRSLSADLKFPLLSQLGPFERALGDQAARVFSGDQPDRAHSVLWDKKKWLASQGGQLPPSQEFVDVAVVGGGMSGLLSAYFLKEAQPVLLEQATRLGGNSKGESWKGIDYSIGAAYAEVPEAGSPIAHFWKEIGIDQKYRVWNGDEPLFLGGKNYSKCWTTGTVPGTQHQFNALGEHLQEVFHGKNGHVYPVIPTLDPEMRKRVNELDQISFQTYLEKVLGEPLHPSLEEYIEHYFWSASGGSYSEISAAAGLNFFAGDFDSIAVFPGGNAAIAEAVTGQLIQSVGAERLRPSSLVVDVKVQKKGVLVSYLNSKNQLQTLQARYVVMACPKFVVAKIVNDLEPERLDAIRSLEYRAYLVANVLIKKPLADSFYDAYFFEGKEQGVQKDHVREQALRQKVTDVILGSLASQDHENAVLTLYRSMPYSGGRNEIYQKGSYEKYQQEFHDQLTQSILPQLGVSKDRIVDLRLSRWGHPLPLSQVGNISSGKVDLISKPFADRVFFVEQDNWTLPAFETAFHEALSWTSELKKLL